MDSENATWSEYLGQSFSDGYALTLETIQNTANATLEFGKEKLLTPELTEKTNQITDKMCLDFKNCKFIFQNFLKMTELRHIT